MSTAGREVDLPRLTGYLEPMPTAVASGDLEIRAALLADLRGTHAADDDAALVEELGVCRGQVRVDVALVNGALHGYEIKSDRDSLRRLARQAEVYGKVLDRATLVTGERHLKHAQAAIPPWWGVVLAQPVSVSPRRRPSSLAMHLTSVRTESPNPGRQARALAELLWLDDVIGLLDERQALRGYRGKPRRVVWDRLCEVYTLDEVGAAVRARLKVRAAQRAGQPPK